MAFGIYWARNSRRDFLARFVAGLMVAPASAAAQQALQEHEQFADQPIRGDKMGSSTVVFTGRRVRVETQRAFEQIRNDLRALVPKTMATEAYPTAMRKAGGFDRSTFESVVKSQLGESDFMLFEEFDYSVWLPLYGVNRKVVRLILGNPIIAITLIRHDADAALFAPVELLLRESDVGGGSTIVYDLPSSLIVIGENPSLLQAALALDAKLEALVRLVTGDSARPAEQLDVSMRDR
jgi:hypothetical protein